MAKRLKKIKKWKLGVTVFALLISTGILITSQIASGEEFVVERLTLSYAGEQLADIDGNKFVWVEPLSSGPRIFLYDGTEIRQLTNDEFPIRNYEPKIGGDYVVWLRELTNDAIPQVFAYKISTEEVIQITNDNVFFKHHPDVSHGKVVWTTIRESNQQSNIALFDIETGETELLVPEESSLSNQEPVISESMVAWRKEFPIIEHSQSRFEIVKMDLSSRIVERLTDNLLFENRLKISGDTLAWIRHDASTGRGAVFIYDGVQVRQLTDFSKTVVDANIKNGQVVWQVPGPPVDQVASYDIATQITEIVADGSEPNTDGSRIVWTKSFDSPSGSIKEVFTRDPITLEITQVSNGAYVQNNTVFVGGGLITWVGEPRDEHTLRDIFIARPPNTDKAVPDLINEVQELIDSGILNNGQGNSLVAKLEAIVRQLEKNNDTAAVQQLHAFVTQVESMIQAGQLAPEHGQTLLDTAQNILEQIED